MAESYEARLKSAEKLKAKIEEAGGESFSVRTWGTPKSKSGFASVRLFIDQGPLAIAGLSIGGDGGLYLADTYAEPEEPAAGASTAADGLEQLLALLSDIGLNIGPNRNTKEKEQPTRAPKVSF